MRLTAFFFLLLALSACGQKGGLYIPQEPAPSNPAAPETGTTQVQPSSSTESPAGASPQPEGSAEGTTEPADDGNKAQNG